ncbi:MAG: PPOX class F420-dependent oxidoreductase [Ktedonobacterales bacterium]|nr:PPOX class F420-dependent oxidoreductase [Ktedonobacterales bacterium]
MAQLDEKTRTFLNEKRFAVLATLNADGTIQQTVMWYLLDGDEVVMNTAAGRVKDGNLRRNPNVSICIEDGYRFVTLSGPVRLSEDQATAQADIRRLAERYGDEGDDIEEDTKHFREQQRVSIRMTVERVIVRT